MKFSIISVLACAVIALAAPVVEVETAVVLKRNSIPSGGTGAYKAACQAVGGSFSCCTNAQASDTGLLGLPLNLQCTPSLPFSLIAG